MSKRKRITNITFDFDGGHVAITDWSQGGAASFENSNVLVKARVPKESDLTEEQKALLAEFGEEFKPLVMKNQDLNKTSSSSSEGVSEDDNKIDNLGNTPEMSEELMKKLEALEAQNKALADQLKEKEAKEVVESLSKYELSEELTKSVADLVGAVSKEQAEVVYKALDALVDAKEIVAKAAAQASPTDLAKALGAEVGSPSKPEELSLGARISKQAELIANKGKK